MTYTLREQLKQTADKSAGTADMDRLLNGSSYIKASEYQYESLRRSVYHAPHTFWSLFYRTRPPSAYSVYLPTASHILKPVHQLFRKKQSSLRYHSPACPPIVTLREAICSLISQYFSYSVGKILSHCHLCMLVILYAPHVAQDQKNCSMDT